MISKALAPMISGMGRPITSEAERPSQAANPGLTQR